MNELQNQSTGMTPSTRRLLMIAGILAGIVLVVIAIVYFLNPANALPSFFPGYSATLTTHHWKHGLLALILGIGGFALAWFNSGSTQKK